ncbi:MAG: M28 family peptidase [Verrucomicrobiales bacterium]
MNDQSKWYGIGLAALPLGFVVLGLISLAIYFLKADDEAGKVSENAENAGIFRKGVELSDLRDYIDMLSVTIGERNLEHHDNLQQAATWLESALGPNNMGYTVERQTYQVGGKDCHNIEVQIIGQTKPDEIVVIGAHYDTVVGTPGADDNASGVAALVCLANTFVGTVPERTLRFVGFANEEPPHFQTSSMGSYVYAKRCKERKENIVAMLSLESLAYYSDVKGSQDYPPILRARYPDTGNFAAVVGNLKSKQLVDQVAARLEEGSGGVPVEKLSFLASLPGVGWSDHWAFWEFGYRAVMVTDTAPYRNEHYHQPSDLPGTLDFDRLQKVTMGLRDVIVELVGDSGALKKPVGKSAKKTK